MNRTKAISARQAFLAMVASVLVSSATLFAAAAPVNVAASAPGTIAAQA